MRRTLIFVMLIVLLVGSGGWYCYHLADTVVRNSYAVWWAADMVIHHLESTDNRWPTGWDDLRDDYEALAVGSGRPWTFDEIRERVEVDWKADPDQLTRKATEYPTESFRVVWLLDGSDHHYQDHEPNEMIAGFLDKRGKTGAHARGR